MPKKNQRPRLKGPQENEPDYEVGYGKPPAKTQFRKGQSGNPGGRPKGARNKTNIIPERMKSILLEEGYRLVRMREGDQVVEMPAIQGVIRSLTAKAINGDHRSQQLLGELLRDVEKENRQDDEKLTTALINCKIDGERELARRAQTGETGPQLFPHPDDIFIDFHAGLIEIRGPMTKEDEVEWKWEIEKIRSLKETIEEFEEISQAQPKNHALRRIIDRARPRIKKREADVGHYAARKQEEERRRKEANQKGI